MNKTKPRRPVPQARRQEKKKCKPCQKVAFPHQYAAYAAALRISRHVGPIRAYRCPRGNGWHLTRLREWIAR